MNLKKLSVTQLAGVVGGFFVLCIVAALVIIKIMKRPPEQVVLSQHPAVEASAQPAPVPAPAPAAEPAPTASPTAPMPATQPQAELPALGQVSAVPAFSPVQPQVAQEPAKDTFGQRINAVRMEQQQRQDERAAQQSDTDLKMQLTKINARLDELDAAIKTASDKPQAAGGVELNAQGIQIIRQPAPRRATDAEAEALQRALHQASAQGLSVMAVVGDHVWAIDKRGGSVEFNLASTSGSNTDSSSESTTTAAAQKSAGKHHRKMR